MKLEPSPTRGIADVQAVCPDRGKESALLFGGDVDGHAAAPNASTNEIRSPIHSAQLTAQLLPSAL